MKFKVGDRVRVYDGGFYRNGEATESPQGPHPSDTIWVVFDKPFFGNLAQDCSPQQCRRLKPKKKAREYWLRRQIYSSGRGGTNGFIYSVFEDRDFQKCDGDEVIHVREVIKK